MARRSTCLLLVALLGVWSSACRKVPPSAAGTPAPALTPVSPGSPATLDAAGYSFVVWYGPALGFTAHMLPASQDGTAVTAAVFFHDSRWNDAAGAFPHDAGGLVAHLYGTTLDGKLQMPDGHECPTFVGTLASLDFTNRYVCTDPAWPVTGSWTARKHEPAAHYSLELDGRFFEEPATDPQFKRQARLNLRLTVANDIAIRLDSLTVHWKVTRDGRFDWSEHEYGPGTR